MLRYKQSDNNFNINASCLAHSVPNPKDRLVSAKGKTATEEINVELASQAVVLKFHRMLPQWPPGPATRREAEG